MVLDLAWTIAAITKPTKKINWTFSHPSTNFRLNPISMHFTCHLFNQTCDRHSWQPRGYPTSSPYDKGLPTAEQTAEICVHFWQWQPTMNIFLIKIPAILEIQKPARKSIFFNFVWKKLLYLPKNVCSNVANDTNVCFLFLIVFNVLLIKSEINV